MDSKKYNAELLRQFTWGDFAKKWCIPINDKREWLSIDLIKTCHTNIIKDLEAVDVSYTEDGMEGEEMANYITEKLKATGWKWRIDCAAYVWDKGGIEVWATLTNDYGIIFEFLYENYPIVSFEFRDGHNLDRLIELFNSCQLVSYNIIFKGV